MRICKKMPIFAEKYLTDIMEITPNVLASIIGGRVEGDGEVKLTGFAKIEEAGPGELSFIANPKYAHFLSTTHASALLVSDDFDTQGQSGPTLIHVADPYSTLAELLSLIEKSKPVPEGIEQPCHIAEDVVVPEGAYIGAFAYVGKGVTLGKNVKIYPQTYIGDGVSIGDDSVIRAGVRIYEGCVIGKRCILHSGCVIGADGFGFAPKGEIYEKIPQTGNVRMEDDVEVGANTTIDRATFGSTVIGHGTKLDNLIQVAHNVKIGNNNVMAAQVGIAGSAKIGNNNRIAGQVGFAGHITVGDGNEIGAQSGIPNDVGDGKRLLGYPAIDARQFAKNLVYLRNMGKVYEKIIKQDRK